MDAIRNGNRYPCAGKAHVNDTDYTRAFEKLPLPRPSSPSESTFTAVPIGSKSPHKLGKDEGGCPCLLIATGSGMMKAEARVPLVLENLAVLFDLRCQVSSPQTDTQSGTFTVVKCVSADSAIRSYFLSLISGIAAAIGLTRDRRRVAAVIEDLVELFRSLSMTPKKEIQGLWGELFLLCESKNPALLAEAWHVSPTDRYDFNKGSERIDVKTTSQNSRRHHFTLDQLCPPDGTRLIVASIMVQSSGAGTSVHELLENIRSRIAGSPSLFFRVMRQVHETLGESWRGVQGVRFDYQAAMESVCYYDGAKIPRVGQPLPDGVSEVSFVAELSRVHAISEDLVASLGELAGCLPLRKPSRRI